MNKENMYITKEKEEGTSSLPSSPSSDSINEVGIITVSLSSFPFARTTTRVTAVKGGIGTCVDADIHRIPTDSAIGGYMPSRVWHQDGDFRLLFYVNPAMPVAARPFASGPVYAFTYPWREGEELLYNAEMRVFIDQINTPVGMFFFFMFGEKTAPMMMKTRFGGETWVGLGTF